jgi:hypothetical protein
MKIWEILFIFNNLIILVKNILRLFGILANSNWFRRVGYLIVYMVDQLKADTSFFKKDEPKKRDFIL